MSLCFFPSNYAFLYWILFFLFMSKIPTGWSNLNHDFKFRILFFPQQFIKFVDGKYSSHVFQISVQETFLNKTKNKAVENAHETDFQPDTHH